MVTYYVYRLDTRTIVAMVTGPDNAACERAAGRWDDNDYGGTYSPACGTVDGLIEADDAEQIEAE